MAPPRSRLESALRLIVMGLLAGAIVSAIAAFTGGQSCEATRLGAEDCRLLVAPYAVRIGLFTAVASVVMALFVRGVLQMAVQNEADRREHREESLG